MTLTPRIAAARFLSGPLESGLTISEIYDFEPFAGLTERDRRFCMELVYGVLRTRSRLDFYVSKLSRTPAPKLDSPVLWILRLGLYQIEFTRVPPHAAVSETVELCRRLGVARAVSLVNAVLRAFVRRRPPLPPGEEPAALAVRLGHPGWLVQRYLQRWGPWEAQRFMEINNNPAEPVFHVNPYRTSLSALRERLSEEGIEFEVYEALPNCLRIPRNFVLHPLFAEGVGFFMDPGSQRIAIAAAESGGHLVGDFCAAPGGKAFLLRELMGPGGRLVCGEFSSGRLSLLARRARQLNIPGLEVVQADMLSPAPFKARFDAILLDVPCSGLGTLRSNPDIRWKLIPEELGRLHDRQLGILRHGFEVLRRGGELVYSTCSTEPEENESVVNDFLFQEKRASLVGEMVRNFPGERPGDCFFYARIRQG